VRNLPLPKVDDEAVYDAVATAKYQPRNRILKGLRARVVAAYLDYESNAPTFGALASVSLGDDERDALRHAYDVDTAPLLDVKRDLTSYDDLICPFCALSDSATLDHYLPKSQYPQFSIFSRNLVPSCWPCNSKKSDAVAGLPFMHPYYEKVPSERFLVVNAGLQPSTMILGFEIDRLANLPDSWIRRLEDHFVLLGLGARYRRMALDELRGRCGVFEDSLRRDSTGAALAGELRREAMSAAQYRGENHWRSALYNALAGNSEFCAGAPKFLR
jgi:hypothetical protein